MLKWKETGKRWTKGWVWVIEIARHLFEMLTLITQIFDFLQTNNMAPIPYSFKFSKLADT